MNSPIIILNSCSILVRV